jgi:hypothetical protein
MDERLLAAVLASPFVITMVGFAVAIAFAPSVPNEIAPATEPRRKLARFCSAPMAGFYSAVDTRRRHCSVAPIPDIRWAPGTGQQRALVRSGFCLNAHHRERAGFSSTLRAPQVRQGCSGKSLTPIGPTPASATA